MDKKIIQKAGKYFTEDEKHKIIQELISAQCTKVEIWEKYTGEEEEHGQLLRWMKQLGYNTGIKTRRPNISGKNSARTQRPKPLAAIQKDLSMQKFITIFLLCFILTQSFSQTQCKVSTYLQGQYNKTIYDRTIGNNPWGMGLGLQLFLNSNSKLKPTIDLTADAYLEDDKIFRMNSDGTEIVDIGGMVNLFAGVLFHPTKKIYMSLVTGPSFVSGQTLLGIKPSFGFYFSENQRWTGKISYINVFNRDKKTKEDFGSVSLSLGVRLF